MRVEDLERELRAERPEPDRDFARQLDEWAAAGFPRDRGLGPRASAGRRDPLEAGRRLWVRLRTVPARRILLPAGALATVAVIGAVAIGQFQDEGTDFSATTVAEDDAQGGGDAESFSAKPGEPTAPGAGNSGAAAVDEYELGELPPSDTIAPDGSPRAADAVAPAAQESTSGVARGTDRRIVDATARITLGAEAGDVQEVANDVVEVTDAHKGIVLDSQVTSDQAGARAAFTLEIPYSRLDAALEEFSGLADVISRTEAGEDITQRAVRARKDLAGVFDEIEKARIDLIEADTREERLIVKARINSLEAQADAFEQDLSNVKRQGRLATVNLEVTSNGPESDDGWSLSDAVDDTGRVLEVMAGVALIALAILLPLTLVGALVWLLAARAQRARRERALDR
jgi:hypothetical protein